jgi:hypothetical protein
MYVDQQVKVAWNGIFSSLFSVQNGVKQGAVISPILFCVYLDVLLLKLQATGVGCFIGNWFVGAIAYADDVVLLAPSANAMRKLLSVCDEFTNNYFVSFNASKTKCLAVHARRRYSGSVHITPLFQIGGRNIEVVEQWSHLGHIISSDMLDDTDIMNRRAWFIGQVNNLLCNFGHLDVLVKNKLFMSYCESLYGCELWDLDSKHLPDFTVAWRKAVRRIWNAPRDTTCDKVYLLSDHIPIMDEICRRSINFVQTCFNSDFALVRFLVSNAMHFKPTRSPLGRNLIFCSLRYDIAMRDLVVYRLTKDFFVQRFRMKLPTEFVAHVNVFLELAFVRDGTFSLPGWLDRQDIEFLIATACT